MKDGDTIRTEPRGKVADSDPGDASAALVAIRHGDLPLLQFPLLARQKGLQHAITTREGGGRQTGPQGFNLARGRAPDPAAVHQNRLRLERALAPGRLVFLHQVHGQAVLALQRPPARAPFPVAGRADAFITDRTGLLLTVLVADCQAVLLFDPRQRVVANVHSGWRGSVANIIGATVEAMVRDFGCRPADLLAGIGPSLGPCCAEFINYRTEIPAALYGHRVAVNHFDFWAISHEQLTAAGLAADHIALSRICTRCHSQRFFSYRAGHKIGRFAAVIGLTAH